MTDLYPVLLPVNNVTHGGIDIYIYIYIYIYINIKENLLTFHYWMLVAFKNKKEIGGGIVKMY